MGMLHLWIALVWDSQVPRKLEGMVAQSPDMPKLIVSISGDMGRDRQRQRDTEACPKCILTHV